MTDCYSSPYTCIDSTEKYRGELARSESKRFSFFIANVNECKSVTIIVRYVLLNQLLTVLNNCVRALRGDPNLRVGFFSFYGEIPTKYVGQGKERQ